MDLTKKGAMDEVFIDPYKLLVNNGWEVVRPKGGPTPGFMVWRKPGVQGKLFVYETGTWQMLNATRHITNGGPDLQSLELFVTNQLKPIEHQG